MEEKEHNPELGGIKKVFFLNPDDIKITSTEKEVDRKSVYDAFINAPHILMVEFSPKHYPQAICKCCGKTKLIYRDSNWICSYTEKFVCFDSDISLP